MSPEQRFKQMEAEIAKLRSELRVRPIRIPAPNFSVAKSEFLQIIQGQTVASGQFGIEYSATLVLSSLYDPDVDTVYPSGLGNAWLWSDGVRQPNRVLVRHDADSYPTFLLAGVRRRVLSTVTLTVASGPDAGMTMTAYRHTWE